MKLLGRVGLFMLGIIVWTLFFPSAGFAAGVVGTGSPASCDSNDLAQALEGGGLVTFNCGNDLHTILSATFVINEDTTIRGDGRIRLDAEDLRQHFFVEGGATLALHDIILLDGESTQGGCVSVNNNGTLNTFGVTFEGCHNPDTTVGGGAVYNLGTFNAINTTFRANRAEEEGGAVFNRGLFEGRFVLFEANTAGDDSGAIENDADGVVQIEDSAFIGNSAAGAGGAVGNTLSFPETNGSFTILRSLLVDNQAATRGGAVHNVTGEIHIFNTTFARNIANEGGAIYSSSTTNTNTNIYFSTFDDNRADTGPSIYRPLTGAVRLGYSILAGGRNEADTTNIDECAGPTFISDSYNLVDDGTCVNDGTDTLNTEPQLGELIDNGGFSLSQLPNTGSPALGKVPAELCVPRDQRLARRSGACDIGAVERGGLFDNAFMPRVHKQS